MEIETATANAKTRQSQNEIYETMKYLLEEAEGIEEELPVHALGLYERIIFEVPDEMVYAESCEARHTKKLMMEALANVHRMSPPEEHEKVLKDLVEVAGDIDHVYDRLRAIRTCSSIDEEAALNFPLNWAISAANMQRSSKEYVSDALLKTAFSQLYAEYPNPAEAVLLFNAAIVANDFSNQQAGEICAWKYLGQAELGCHRLANALAAKKKATELVSVQSAKSLHEFDFDEQMINNLERAEIYTLGDIALASDRQLLEAGLHFPDFRSVDLAVLTSGIARNRASARKELAARFVDERSEEIDQFFIIAARMLPDFYTLTEEQICEQLAVPEDYAKEMLGLLQAAGLVGKSPACKSIASPVDIEIVLKSIKEAGLESKIYGFGNRFYKTCSKNDEWPYGPAASETSKTLYEESDEEAKADQQ